MIEKYVIEDASKADKGWGDLYYHVMPRILNEYTCKVGVEVGVAWGGHSNEILKNTNVEKLYGVDPYLYSSPDRINDGVGTDGFFHEDKRYGQKEYDDLYKYTTERLNIYGNRFQSIRKSSILAVSEIKEDLDFVFIDAQHTYKDVLDDLNVWYDKVKIRGIVSGHDYNHISFPGVTQAVNEFFYKKGLTVNIEDGHVWWVLKTNDIL